MMSQSGRSRDNLFPRYLVLVVVVTAVALVICITGLYKSHAQSSTGSIKTDFGIYPEGPAPPLPGAGGIVDDQIFGARIMRATDEADGANLGTYYSYWPTFNANNTRLLVQGDSGHGFIRGFDPDTFTLGAKERIPPTPSGYLVTEGATWSGTDPNVLYGSAGTTIYAYNVATHTHTVVVSLTSLLPAGEYLWQQSKSLDDDFFAFTRRGADYGFEGDSVYRKSTKSLIVKDEPELDEVTISKDGQYLLVKTRTQGLGLIESKVLNTATGQLEKLIDSAPDYAPGHGDAGIGSYVGYDNWRNEINYRNLAAPHIVSTLLTLPDWSLGASHSSMLADNEGWVLTGFIGGTDDHVLRNEVIQIATDGSQRIRRLFHHRSVYRAYYDSPRANISRDGRFVAFTSNWGGRTRTDLFIAKIQDVAPTSTPTATSKPRLMNPLALKSSISRLNGVKIQQDDGKPRPIRGPVTVEWKHWIFVPPRTLPTKVSVPANVLWFDTGVTLKKGEHFSIAAAGLWSNIGTPALGPDGSRGTLLPGTLLPSASLGSLIGKVGDVVFPVTGKFEGTSPAGGRLFLTINDTPSTFEDNQGELQVRIYVKRLGT